MEAEHEKRLNDLEDCIHQYRKHSGYARCYECQTFGVPFPHDRVCGNCGSAGLVKFHDEESVLAMLDAHIRALQATPPPAKEEG